MPTLGAIADAPGAAGALLVVDAVTDDDLRTVSRATAHLGLVTGAAGLVLGLTGPRPGDARATPASGPGARAVVHPRSRHATAVSCLPPWSRRSAVPPLTPYFVMRVGQTPLLPHAAPGDAGQARERERQDHGPVVSGGSVRAAVDAAVGLEEVCAPVLALGDRPARLPTEEEAGEPAGRYGSCWGGSEYASPGGPDAWERRTGRAGPPSVLSRAPRAVTAWWRQAAGNSGPARVTLPSTGVGSVTA
ncbi:class II aldolase/adducin family protein [Streptomyces diastaticus]|uniref:class II aldolase/adducin family protein n=1 Tax=Streptomyces diastaticus TaxID=1956 RepID=UPI00379DA316